MINNKKIKNILEHINSDLQEREEIASIILLCMIANKSVFLYGPPGTGKSYIARKVASVFESDKFFDYLMGKFSTPEEIFGPFKLSELKQDNLERDIEGFLPSVDFAFLDEIWKSSPAILNSLLTILNEKIFKNGKETIKVPLKGLISASNEFPQANQGLEALYDRFIARLEVMPIANKDNFKKFIQNESKEVKLKEKIKNTEIEEVLEKSKIITIDEKVLDILGLFRDNISIYNNENKDSAIYISDRKYKMIFELIRVMAVLCGREKIEIGDLILLEYCAWDKPEQKEIIKEALVKAIKDFSPKIMFDFSKINKLKKTIKYEIKYQKEDFAYVKVDDEEYIYTNQELKTYYGDSQKTISIYIKKESLYKTDFQEIYYKDQDGYLKKLYDFRYKYDDKSHKIYHGYNARHNGYDYANKYQYDNVNNMQYLISVIYTYKKGDYKKISSFVQQSFIKELKNNINTIENHMQKCEEEKEKFIQTMNNPFFDKNKFDMYFKALEDTKSNLKAKKIECERYLKILEEDVRITN
ncbi:AAA family ATPase [Campylobacter sp. 2018MI01]|uniref:AAA family ATPase n=1 Tax=Campylobacter sp. 2018MI01 TaxID=2836735 RepID=UPI001BDA4903|nr:AAA family ATPase [Campylobacter sp. 2018MI01]MBT0879452.1 AAA family ATPase [Campylobacter sp. 2018MI01]